MVAHPADGTARSGEPEAAPVDEQLAAAGRRAIERHGVEHATLERIAAEAGLSRVTLYRRGVTREAVLAALADAVLEDYRRALWPALTGRGSGAERLRRALSSTCEVAEDSIGVLLALGERVGAHAAEREGRAEASTRRGFVEPLERLLRDGEADGSLRQADARETATALLNMTVWTYVHLRAGARWSARRARAATLDLALRGVVSAVGSGAGHAAG